MGVEVAIVVVRGSSSNDVSCLDEICKRCLDWKQCRNPPTLLPCRSFVPLCRHMNIIPFNFYYRLTVWVWEPPIVMSDVRLTSDGQKFLCWKY